MGTGSRKESSSRGTQTVDKKPPRCSVCRQVYTPMCDFMQGRCPHHPAMIELGLMGRQARTRFQNIINLFKRKSKCK